MVNKTKGFGILLVFLFLSLSVTVWSQQETDERQPVFTCDAMVHDFGKIREKDRWATHEFVVKNTGTAPLVITHVLTSCGCTQPEWSKTPIEPGKEGFVIVSYDMMDRPGPFSKNITAYTNENRLRQVFTIMGDVIPKPETLDILFRDTIGNVQMERTSFMFYTVQPQEIIDLEIWIRNFGDEDVNVVIENIPEYLNVIVPARLEKDYPERLKITLDATKVDQHMRGRLLSRLTWKEVSASGKIITQTIPISANFIDNLSSMSPAKRAEGPAASFSTTFLEFGKLKKKRVYKEIVITNKGLSDLTFHSISTDDPNAQITGFNKRTLRPEEKLSLRIYVNPKNFKDYFATDLVVVSNDPREPVREIHILAEK